MAYTTLACDESTVGPEHRTPTVLSSPEMPTVESLIPPDDDDGLLVQKYRAVIQIDIVDEILNGDAAVIRYSRLAGRPGRGDDISSRSCPCVSLLVARPSARRVNNK